MTDFSKIELSIDFQERHQSFVREDSARRFIESLDEAQKVLLFDRQTAGIFMTAKFFQEIAAATKSLHHMKAADAACRSLPFAPLKTQHYGWTMKSLHHPGGDNAEHTRVPAFAAQD